jgi:hypothetical protein
MSRDFTNPESSMEDADAPAPLSEVAAINGRMLQLAEEKARLRRREAEIEEEACGLLRTLYNQFFLLNE